MNLGSGPRLGRQLAARGGGGGGSALCSFSFIPTWRKSAFLVYLCLLEGGVSGCRHFLRLPLEQWQGRLEETNAKSNPKCQCPTSPFLSSPSASPWHPLPGAPAGPQRCPCPARSWSKPSPVGAPRAFRPTFTWPPREGSRGARRGVWRSPAPPCLPRKKGCDIPPDAHPRPRPSPEVLQVFACLKRFSVPAGRTDLRGLRPAGGCRGGGRVPLCCLGGAASPLPRSEAPRLPSRRPGFLRRRLFQVFGCG